MTLLELVAKMGTLRVRIATNSKNVRLNVVISLQNSYV